MKKKKTRIRKNTRKLIYKLEKSGFYKSSRVGKKPKNPIPINDFVDKYFK
jgi:hypothetical protein